MRIREYNTLNVESVRDGKHSGKSIRRLIEEEEFALAEYSFNGEEVSVTFVTPNKRGE